MKRHGDDADDPNARKRGRGGGGGGGGPHEPCGPYAFKALCPEPLVSKMLNDQASMLHNIEAESSSRLQFSPRGQFFPGTKLRILTVKSPEEACVMRALAMVMDEIIVRDEYGRSNNLTQGEFSDNRGLLFKCAFPKALAGALIGAKGDRINKVRQSSGATIDVDRDVVGTHQVATVAGEREQILNALEYICTTVQQGVEQDWFQAWADERTIGSGSARGDGGGREGGYGDDRDRDRGGDRHWDRGDRGDHDDRGNRDRGGYDDRGRGYDDRGHDDRGNRDRGTRDRGKGERNKGMLFVGRLSQVTTHESFGDHFSQFGAVREAVVAMDNSTGRSKGFGFVTFEDPESAEACLSITHGHEIDERRVDVKRYDERERNRSDGASASNEAGEAYSEHPVEDAQLRSTDYSEEAARDLQWFAGIAEGVTPSYLGLDYCISFSLPSDKCGAIIGRKGETVRSVKQETGANIEINPKDPNRPEEYRAVTITGRMLSVYAAHMLLMRHYNDGESAHNQAEEAKAREEEEKLAQVRALEEQLATLSKDLKRMQGGKGGSSRR